MGSKRKDELRPASPPHLRSKTKNRSKMDEWPDTRIWNNFRSGDEAAFIFIYEKNFDKLVNYCYQYTRNEALIKDCVQDLFIYIRTKRNSLSATNNISAYLLRSCKNRLIAYLKKELKVKTLSDLNKQIFIPTFSDEDKIIHLQSREINERRLKQAIAKLSPKEREVIYCFYFMNMDYQSISEFLGYDHVKSTRSLLYKALRKLKDLFMIPFAFLSM